MAKALHHKRYVNPIIQSQLGDTFLSSKHQDYLAAIAEFISEMRASRL